MADVREHSPQTLGIWNDRPEKLLADMRALQLPLLLQWQHARKHHAPGPGHGSLCGPPLGSGTSGC